jgi:transglutaminase-like putative cysteine protease
MPRGLLGAGLVFWGWQTGALPVGIGLALAVEAARAMSLRFELRGADFSRISDLTAVAFLALAALLAATRGMSDGVLATVQWLPAVLAPVLVAQLVSTAGRLPLSALFRRLRRRKARAPETQDPLLDVTGIYLAFCVVAAGAANARGPGYFAGVAALAAWALFAVRPRHAGRAAWAGALIAAGALGFGAQAGLVGLQGLVEEWVIGAQLRGMNTDPHRNTTELGSIGRLKQYDTIVMRVHADPRRADGLQRLHRASYTTYTGTTWRTRRADLKVLQPEADGTTWTFAQGPDAPRVRLTLRLEEGKALLALPPGTLRVASLPALSLKRNELGAVQADLGGGDWVHYAAEHMIGVAGYAPPAEDDLALPAVERAEFERLAAELGLVGGAPETVVRRIEAHFSGFAYSTFRETAPPAGMTALAEFLRTSKKGHCEYFAAATTLLLRATGIPARYATGYSVQEYSELERAYVVRARHAHAWTRAWVDGRWIDVDTTPPDWFAAEERLGPAWQGLADLVRWATYRWSQRGELQIGPQWFALLAVLVAVLGWRVVRGKRAHRGAAALSSARRREWAGGDSEFYRVEKALVDAGHVRATGESLTAWARRVRGLLDVPARERFDDALRLHLRYRFDPDGLDEDERRGLRDAALALAGTLAQRA